MQPADRVAAATRRLRLAGALTQNGPSKLDG
jgi:hypothetical protein